jgi:hypothetical protein
MIVITITIDVKLFSALNSNLLFSMMIFELKKVVETWLIFPTVELGRRLAGKLACSPTLFDVNLRIFDGFAATRVPSSQHDDEWLFLSEFLLLRNSLNSNTNRKPSTGKSTQ